MNPDETRAETIRRQREEAVERFNLGKTGALPDSFFSAVVGVSFVSGYPDNLYELERAALIASLGDESLTAVIVRNPANAFDENACEVHIPALGRNAMVGHLTRPTAARLAPELDGGTQWAGSVEYVRIDPDDISNPGLSIRLTRITQKAA